MSQKRTRIARFAALCLGASCLTMTAAADGGAGEEWQFISTPYLWLPSISATLNFDVPTGATGNPQVESDPLDPLSNLKFGFMGVFELRKGEWFLLSDVMYSDIGDKAATVLDVTGPGGVIQVPIDVNTKMQFQNSEFGAVIGKTVADNGDARLDVFAGVRWLGARVTLDWNFAGPLGLMPQSGSFEQDRDSTNAIAGVRGRFNINEDWYAHYYVDAGAGSADITAQAIAGVGYKTGWGDLQLAYRHLYVNEGSDGFLDEMTMSGFALGLTMKM